MRWGTEVRQLDDDERGFLLELLREEEAAITSGSTVYGNKDEVLDIIYGLMDALEEEN